MKKKLQILSFFIAISFFSCASADKNPLFSDLNTDFPTSEKLELKPLNKLNILDDGSYMIDGSILWCFGQDEHSVGYCYDLNTGEKLSTIATRGKAINELIEFEGC